MRLGRSIALLLFVVLIAAVASAAWVGREALAARTQLETVQAELAAAQAAALDADADAFDAAIERATTAAGEAVANTDGPLWSVAARVPRYGDNARVAALAARLAQSSTTLAGAAGTSLADIARAPQQLVDGGAVDVDRLGELATQLEGLPLDPVRADLDALRAVPPDTLLDVTARGRREALRTGDDAVATLERAEVGARAFAGFLGGDEPRRYLLGIQNPGELRGTGGLIAYVAEVAFADGRIQYVPPSEAADDFAEDTLTTDVGRIFTRDLEPVDRPVDFAERYDVENGGSTSQSVNLDPDLPTVGPVLNRLYADRTARAELDGIILMDPLALELLIPVTGGPLALPEEFAAVDGLPTQLTGANTAQTLLIDVYDAIGGRNSAERGRLDEAVTLSVLARLAGGDYAPVPFANALVTAAQERHLQLWSADEQEQASFELLGIAGALPEAAPGTDYLALSGVNAGPDKSDVHVGHRITASVDLEETTDPSVIARTVRATVEVDNPLVAGSRDTYIVGTEEPTDGQRRGVGTNERVDNAKNWTWFTWWVPDTTYNRSARDERGDLPVGQGSIGDHRTLDVFLETPAESSNAFTVRWASPVEVSRTGRGFEYNLVLWRQGKGIPDQWDVSLTPPAGFRFTEANLSGGGRGVGLGVDGDDPQPLELLTLDQQLRVTGSATADVRIHVRVVPVGQN